MTTRFDWERAFVGDVELRHGPRGVLHVLSMRIDKDEFRIPSRWQPSLRELAREVGTDRTTVDRWVGRAESAGWVDVKRPTRQDARLNHAKNHYIPRFPEGHPLSALSGQPVAVQRPELSVPDSQPVRPVRTKSSGSSGSSVSSEVDVVIGAIETRTGKQVERGRAALIRDELLSKARGSVRNPARYLASAIEREADPSRWLPTPTPPRFRRHITEEE